ncbi:hypothetical protein D0839_02210 [Bordetella avium]|nr:hypothetical protein C0J09_05315 [Bordetella avium]AZY54222.1 hypothetical protein C0J07_05380 [Bordetella avium]RIQ14306.1 hypothetical protein D0432_06535 [Bordetella avium]RIQ17179.1 hypothetical protein D0850_11985 [Bordetella avium]RIQ36655.1 hypothetical protein D0849_00935 [Bordetella avium]
MSSPGQAWQFEVPTGLPAGTRWPVALPAILAGAAGAAQPCLLPALLPVCLRGRRSFPSALGAHPDPRRWRARGVAGWHPALLHDVIFYRSHMVLIIESRVSRCVTNSKINCTVWRRNLTLDKWRRFRVVARIAVCEAAFLRGAS